MLHANYSMKNANYSHLRGNSKKGSHVNGCYSHPRGRGLKP